LYCCPIASAFVVCQVSISWVASGFERGPAEATGWPLPDGDNVGDAVAFATGDDNPVALVEGEVAEGDIVVVGDAVTVGETATDGEGDRLSEGSGIESSTKGESEDEAAGANN
jgi:hypothetical protein